MRYLKWPVTVLIFIGIFFFFQGLLVPKYTREAYDGALIREYYNAVKDHDVLIIGDCEVYENISTVALWEEHGITSFIRGSAVQLMWQSYYLLEESLRYEKPKTVVFSIMAMQYPAPRGEEYNRLTLDDMRLSPQKIKAVRASRMAHENPLSYIFPILRYNARWSELTPDDFRYFFAKPPFSVNGYTIRSDIRPAGFVPTGNPRPSYRFADICYEYLDKATRLCKENDIPLVLIKAPVLYPWWYPEWDEQMAEYARENDLLYINFLEHTEEMGLDFTTDTYNAGLHLNIYGAEKLAKYLGGLIKKEYNLTDRRNEPDTAARWDKKSETYRKVVDRQRREIQEHGKIVTFLIDGL